MKAKQLCPCSPCSYVRTLGLALEKVHFTDKLQNLFSRTEVQHVRHTLMSLSFKNGLFCCLYYILVFHCSLHFSLNRSESDTVYSTLVGMIQDPSFKSQAGPEHSPHFWKAILHLLGLKNTCHFCGKLPSMVKTWQLEQGWCCDI